MSGNIFYLETKNGCYVFGVDGSGLLCHLHWGEKLPKNDFELSETEERNSNHSSKDYIREEYSVFGGTRYREVSLKCIYSDGCRDGVFLYKSAKQEENRLTITLEDSAYDIRLILTYEYSTDSDIITRTAQLKNNSAEPVTIERIMSGELNLPGRNPYKVINTNGSWGAEFLTTETELKSGELVFESRKGTAGHTHSPFLILHRNATEEDGDVYFASLGYGGNFKAEAHRDFCGTTRCYLGISDFDFSYTLNSGDSFVTPKLYMGYTKGFDKMTNGMNDFAVNHILPKAQAEKILPVLYNSWEATEFDVSTDGQLRLAKIAAKIGCELFVMDDGWFGARNSDRAGLGDWAVNNKKFPKGVDELIEGVNALGMDFGIWFEPEMVQQDSDLYREHPDWTYHYDKREPSELRHQLVLNLTKKDVKEYAFSVMDKMVSEHNIKYIKWDMNRPFSEIGADNLENGKELWYRHTVAVYEIADRLHKKHPCLHIEACSSGGGRAEYGALEHFDSVWTSDNTDPIDRLTIQHGYSLLYPHKCMRAWVTDWNDGKYRCKNSFRFCSSMQGALSIGSNLLNLSDEDIEEYKENVAMYKKIRTTVQTGDLHRLAQYDKDGFHAVQYVAKDKKQSVIFFQSGANGFFNQQDFEVKLRGFDDEKQYQINNKIKSGKYLNGKYFTVHFDSPFDSKIIVAESLT